MNISDDWRLRPCPCCGDLNAEAKPEISSNTPAEYMDWNSVKESFVGLRKHQVFFSYYRCCKCELLYCPYYFDENQLLELYRSMPDNLMGENVGTAAKTQQGYAEIASQNKVKLETYLELGPDTGLLAKEIGIKFKPKKAFLIEPNRQVHIELANNTKTFEETEISTELESANIPPSSVDLTLGVHVFDHLISPKITLRKIFQLSSETSTIGIVVHNEKSILRRLLNRKWPPFCLQHPQLFNSTTIATLLNASGWDVEHVSRTTNHYSFANILRLAHNLFGIQSPKLLDKLNFQIPIKLGNIQVAAKKSRGKSNL